MARRDQEKAWEEIRFALRSFSAAEPKPHLILLPELALPRGCVHDLERISKALGSIIISGIDYRLDYQSRKARNEAFVMVPDNWPTNGKSKRLRQVTVGKTIRLLRRRES